jgi:hypothetical protein
MRKCERCGGEPHPGPVYATVWPYARCPFYVPRAPWYLRALTWLMRGKR